MKKKCILGLLVLVSVSVFLIGFGLSTQLAEACELCSEPTRIILVRHGQTHWNVLHILQGNADIPLDETGLAQTEYLSQELADKNVLVRRMDGYSVLNGFLRTTVGRREDNLALLEALEEAIPLKAILFVSLLRAASGISV